MAKKSAAPNPATPAAPMATSANPEGLSIASGPVPAEARKEVAIRRWVDLDERLGKRRRIFYAVAAGLAALGLVPGLPTISFIAFGLSSGLGGAVLLRSIRPWLFNATCADAGLSFPETKALWRSLEGRGRKRV
jgi:hypothetical protein